MMRRRKEAESGATSIFTVRVKYAGKRKNVLTCSSLVYRGISDTLFKYK